MLGHLAVTEQPVSPLSWGLSLGQTLGSPGLLARQGLSPRGREGVLYPSPPQMLLSSVQKLKTTLMSLILQYDLVFLVACNSC